MAWPGWGARCPGRPEGDRRDLRRRRARRAAARRAGPGVPAPGDGLAVADVRRQYRGRVPARLLRHPPHRTPAAVASRRAVVDFRSARRVLAGQPDIFVRSLRRRGAPGPRGADAVPGGPSGAHSRAAGRRLRRRTAAARSCGPVLGMTSDRHIPNRPGGKAMPCSWCASSHTDEPCAAKALGQSAVQPPAAARRTRARVRPAARARILGCPQPAC